jgi:hypothetical protein
MQPSEFRVARTTTNRAPRPVVFAQVQRLPQVGDLESLGKIDPRLKASYEGAPAGVGAAYAWAGNSGGGVRAA